MPATDTAALLKYRIQPDRVFVGITTSLTLEVRNETTRTIAFASGDAVEVTFPAGEGETALSRVIDYEPRALTDGFSVTRVEGTGTYRLRAAGFEPRDLLPGKAVVVSFDGVKVNGVKGDATVAVLELLEEEAHASVTVSKIPQELNVVAWLENLVVGLGEETVLHWESFGGTRVVVAGFDDGTLDPACPEGDRQPGYRCFPVTGPPPSHGQVGVGIPATEPQWTYTVQVWTGDGKHRETRVTLTQHKAEIIGFGAAPGMVQPTQPIGAMDEVPLLWASLYGVRADLRTPIDSSGTRVSPNPARPRATTPGRDAWTGAGERRPIPATAEYILRVTGFRDPAEVRLVYQLKPVRVLYFRYSKLDSGKLSEPVWAVDPKDWPGVQVVISTPPYTLTVHGPGETKVLYLGPGDTVHPQVQYFAATDGAGGKKTLRWITANVTALRLEPPGHDVPAAQIADGTFEVSPTQTTDYVLRATSASGETITSTLRVVV